MRVLYVYLSFILLALMLPGCNNTPRADSTDTLQTLPTISNEYSALADTARQTLPFESCFADNPQIDNIERPPQSYIISDIDTTLLFNIWVYDPEGPHADFDLNADYFDVADYDGDSRMPYVLHQHDLIVFYNDGIRYGRIVSLTKDSLRIYWREMEDTTCYVRWTN